MLLQLTWDAILYNIAWGCLIGGGIITVVAMILSGMQLGHALGSDAGSMDHDVSGADHDIAADHDVGHDIAADHDLSHDMAMDHDLSHDLAADHDLSHDMAADHDLSHDLAADHDFSHDLAADHDLGHDMAMDHDLGHDMAADHDLSHDLAADHDLGHDMAIDHDFSADHDSPLVTSQTGAPLLLILSAWFLWFGVLGVSTYYSLTQKEIWVGIITVVPMGLSYAMSAAWRKIAKSQTYKVSVGFERVGEVAEVHRPITDEGGMVRVKTDSPLGFEVLPAKPLQALEKFAVGQKVYLCDLQKGFYLVSTHSKFIRRYKPRPQ